MGRKIWFTMKIDDEIWEDTTDLQLFQGKGLPEAQLNSLFALDDDRKHSWHICSSKMQLNQCDVERMIKLDGFHFLDYYMTEKEEPYRHRVPCLEGFNFQPNPPQKYYYVSRKPKSGNNERVHFINAVKLLKFQKLPSDEFLAHCKQQQYEQERMREMIQKIKTRHFPYHCYLTCMS